jgi:hypothetical protein
MPTRPPRHIPIGAKTPGERRKSYRSDGRTSHPFYSLQRWKKLRRAYLAQHPLCECGCGYASVEVDHRVPHRGDPRLMWDWSNLQHGVEFGNDRFVTHGWPAFTRLWSGAAGR